MIANNADSPSSPLVSVIMPCYNMASFVIETIRSVQAQTYTPWELLIVDDASTDTTVDLIRGLSEEDPRIQLQVKPSHSGIADSRNQCLKQAKGRYIAFLDADDVWHPDKLERQVRFMQEHDIAFSYASYDTISETGEPLDKVIQAKTNLDYEAYLRNTIIGCSTVMLDAAKVGEVVVPQFRTSEDTATWLNLLRKGIVAYAIPTPLASYRIRRKSASSNKIKTAYDLWKVYRQQERLSFFYALNCFFHYAFNAIKKRVL